LIPETLRLLFILYLGLLLAIFLWKGRAYRSLRIASLAAFILMTAIFLWTIPSLRGQQEGLIQRFVYLGWSVWSIALSIQFIGMLKTKISGPV
jgi:hypothetical protein